MLPVCEFTIVRCSCSAPDGARSQRCLGFNAGLDTDAVALAFDDIQKPLVPIVRSTLLLEPPHACSVDAEHVNVTRFRRVDHVDRGGGVAAEHRLDRHGRHFPLAWLLWRSGRHHAEP
jgi:hypothetical protein